MHARSGIGSASTLALSYLFLCSPSGASAAMSHTSSSTVEKMAAGRIFAQNDALLLCLNGTGVLGNLAAFGLSILFQAQLSIYVAVACAISHGVFLLIEYKWIRLSVSVVVLGGGIAELVLIHGQYEFQFDNNNLWIIGDIIDAGLQWLAQALALIPQAMGYINIVVGAYMFLIAYTEVLCGGGGGTTTNNSNFYYVLDPRYVGGGGAGGAGNPNQPNQANQPNQPKQAKARQLRRGRRGRRTRAILHEAGQLLHSVHPLDAPVESDEDELETPELPLLVINA